MANAGTTSSACSIFVRNPNPTSAPASASQRADATSSARVVAYAPATSSSTSSASGLSKRNISTATGVSANAAPATSPAAGPAQRFTVRYSNQTAATPSSACGTRIDQALTPKTRADRSITHSEAGVLSTVMKFDASELP